MTSKLNRIKEILLSLSDRVYRYHAPDDAVSPYIVWAEDMEGSSFWADNKKQAYSLQGTIDYYAKEYDEVPDKIIRLLSDEGFKCNLNSTQYEDQTELIHKELVFEVR